VSKPAANRSSVANLAWAIGGVVWLALLVGLLFLARDWAFEELTTTEARADWESWRAEVRRQHADGATEPVRRRVPQSAEPPSLVLLRDHFGACLGGTLIFGSLLYVVSVIFLRGALCQNPGERGA